MSSKTLEMARKLVKRLEEEEKKSKVKLCELHPGDTFKIGDHDFIVLKSFVYRQYGWFRTSAWKPSCTGLCVADA